MQTISNVATLPDYDDTLTLGPDDFEALQVDIWNESAVMQIFSKPGGHAQQGSWLDEIIVAPSTVSLQRCGGVRFKTVPGGAAARIVGYAWRDGEPLIMGGVQLQGTLTPGGTVTPPGLGMITARVDGSTGAVVEGTGITVVVFGVGVYDVTYTTPFASPALVLAVQYGTNDGAVAITSSNTTGVRIQTFATAGAAANRNFMFAATAMV